MWSTILTGTFLIGLLQATLRTTTPLLLAAIGELYGERAGVLNIGLEGIMLIGTLIGFLASYVSGNVWIGILAGSLAGGLVALIHAVLCVTLGVSQVVSGVGINILCTGLSLTIYRVVFGPSLIKAPMATGAQPIYLPVLSDLPLVGPILFQQLPTVYIAFALVPITWFVFYRTELGLKIRAVGEHPLAAETLGVDVVRIRYLSVLVCGLLTGMAGTFLSLGLLNIFLDNMTAGRGWIALAVVIFGRYQPGGILGAALFFGFADALQLRLQTLNVNVPYQFLLMIPYGLTMIALVSAAGRRAVGPAALGKPFAREAH